MEVSKVKLAITYEIEISLGENLSALEPNLTEILSRYLPPQHGLEGNIKNFINTKLLQDPKLLSLETNEEAAIERALTAAKGSVMIAAGLLGITRATLYVKMKKYKIERSHDVSVE